MKFRFNLEKVNDIFLPASKVGGLQVTNSSIRFLRLEGSKTTHDISLRLPPGIIDGGRVKDRINFVAALKEIHKKVEVNPKKNVNVILTVPTGDVYAEAFSVPKLAGAQLNEAVNLNMQVLSPNPIDKTYYSWMITGEDLKGSGQIEILGAFVLKNIIDDYIFSLEEAGFGVAAIEFSSLSLVRMLVDSNAISKDTPTLLIKLTQEGLIFMIIRNGNLYFDYFHSWDKFNEDSRGITLSSITDIISSESTRVLNFYSNRWGGQIKSIVLISPALVDEISAFLQSSYPGFDLKIIPSDKENYHGVKGAAIRGLMSRSADNELNLMDPESINAFWQDEIIGFVKLWRNIIVTTLSFLILIFFGGKLFIDKYYADHSFVTNPLNAEDRAELISLKAEAQNFNAEVQSIQSLNQSNIKLSPQLSVINQAVNSGIIITRLNANADQSGSMDGLASDQKSIQDLKTKLAAIADVSLPFSGINPLSNGQFSFSLTYKIKPKQ